MDEKLMMGIVRVGELFKKNTNIVLKNYGLSLPQYRVLRILDASAEKQNTIGNVSKIMFVSGGNLTSISKRLERKGFIIRNRNREDDRIIILKITQKGKQSLEKIKKIKNRNINRYFSKYSNKEKIKILQVIKTILQSH